MFAESAGKKGGEFYTPRSVVKLMVRLVHPQEGMRVYDPCCGSGGMLIYSKMHVEEHGGNAANLGLYGQDKEGSAWVICKMNMILHGVTERAFIANDDTLENPVHMEVGELMRFHRVLSNPPFSMNYDRSTLTHTERFNRYGFSPDTGKKADLYVCRTHGRLVAARRHHGHGHAARRAVPRRERMEIRKKFIEDDLIEAIVSLPNNLFFGTGIPACILVMRRPHEKPAERQGKILFINADRDHVIGRRRSFLRFLACERDLSKEPPNSPLPDAVASGAEPLLIIGAPAGGWRQSTAATQQVLHTTACSGRIFGRWPTGFDDAYLVQ